MSLNEGEWVDSVGKLTEMSQAKYMEQNSKLRQMDATKPVTIRLF
jgi:hypothetical protein